MYEFKTVRELYELHKHGNQIEKDSLMYVELEGWIRTNRDNGTIGFIALSDGTFFKTVQLVYDQQVMNQYDAVKRYATGSAIRVVGEFKWTPEAKQPFEIHAKEIELLGDCSDDYPLQKKRHSYEFLREISHVRTRGNTFQAVFRIRSLLAMAIHEFFQSQGFIYVHTPIITGNDAEGAGESFTVTTRTDDKYEKDFFGKHASLSVSGQLHAEAFALAFRDVYTFGPTFRAENSNTSTHASEFWMIEPEIAFANLIDDMDLIEDTVKFCIEYILVNAPEEIEFLNEFVDKELKGRLEQVVSSNFARVTYTEAIEILKASKRKFEFPFEWGDDLKTEHERYLCEQHFKGPVFVTDYPKDIKAFYMRLNDDQKTVAACDLLVPGIGELVGGSQREERYDHLIKRMEEMNIPRESLEWYIDLRRFGGCEHAGFGIGFERFVMYLTGMSNIRDVIPFARTPKNLNY